MRSRALIAEILMDAPYPVPLWAMLRGNKAQGVGCRGGLMEAAASASPAFVCRPAPAVQKLPLSTNVLFDLAVYLSAWGAIGGYCLALLGTIEASP